MKGSASRNYLLRLFVSSLNTTKAENETSFQSNKHPQISCNFNTLEKKQVR